MHRLAAGALAATLLACASQRRIDIRPPKAADLSGATLLSWVGPSARGFYDARGRPCPALGPGVADAFVGWWAEEDDQACWHDTVDTKVRPGVLELRWRGVVPADGSYEVVSAGYAVRAWGTVVARGSYAGQFWAGAHLVVEATSPRCSATWSAELVTAKVALPMQREGSFGGWTELSGVHLAGCRAGDELEVRVQLVARANHGSVAVDSFGFSVPSDRELGRMFGLRPAKEVAAAPRLVTP